MLTIGKATKEEVADLLGNRIVDGLDLQESGEETADYTKTVLQFNMDTGATVVLEGDLANPVYALLRGANNFAISHTDASDLRGGMITIEPSLGGQIGAALPLMLSITEVMAAGANSVVRAVSNDNDDANPPYVQINWPANSGESVVTIYELNA